MSAATAPTPGRPEPESRALADVASDVDAFEELGDPCTVQEPEPLPRCCQAWIAEQARAWIGRRP